MKKNLIITDLDDSLLPIGKDFSVAYRKLLNFNKFSDIIVATGRFESVLNIATDPEVNNITKGWVFCNGAAVLQNEKIKYFIISKKDIDNVLKILLLTQKSNSISLLIEKEIGSVFYPHLDDDINLTDSFSIKFFISNNDSFTVNTVINCLSFLKLNFIIDSLSKSKEKTCIQILANNVNKKMSASSICDFTQYDNIYLFGDAANDYSLFLSDNSNNINPFLINKKTLLTNVHCISSFENEEIDLSSPYTLNNTILNLNNGLVTKHFGKPNSFWAEKFAYSYFKDNDFIVKSKFDNKKHTLIQPLMKSRIIDLLDILRITNELHNSSDDFTFCYDFETDIYYSSWIDFISSQLLLFDNYDKFKNTQTIQHILYKLKDDIDNCNLGALNCIIHRDIRNDNFCFNTEDNKYKIIDFELCMIGNPTWDYARIAFEHNLSAENILQINYNIKNIDLSSLKFHILFYAISFLFYLMKNELGQDKIEKTLSNLSKFWY